MLRYRPHSSFRTMSGSSSAMIQRRRAAAASISPNCHNQLILEGEALYICMARSCDVRFRNQNYISDTVLVSFLSRTNAIMHLSCSIAYAVSMLLSQKQ